MAGLVAQVAGLRIFRTVPRNVAGSLTEVTGVVHTLAAPFWATPGDVTCNEELNKHLLSIFLFNDITLKPNLKSKWKPLCTGSGNYI